MCVFLVICIGLCVDYSAHIAHAFIICEGTSTERSAYGFSEMGAAIFHGGTTTFVALREGSSKHSQSVSHFMGLTKYLSQRSFPRSPLLCLYKVRQVLI